MIKVIIFDVDGVLVHGSYFSHQLEKDYGITKEITTPFFSGPFQDCLIGKADLKEIIKEYLPQWGWKGTVEELLAYWFKAEHNLNEEMITFVEDLKKKGIEVYVATNQEKYRTEYMMKEMGLGAIFKMIFSSAHLGSKKPEQEFFKIIMSHLHHVNKDEVLFWDDTPGHIEGAKQFGIYAELFISIEDFKKKTEEYLMMS